MRARARWSKRNSCALRTVSHRRHEIGRGNRARARPGPTGSPCTGAMVVGSVKAHARAQANARLARMAWRVRILDNCGVAVRGCGCARFTLYQECCGCDAHCLPCARSVYDHLLAVCLVHANCKHFYSFLGPYITSCTACLVHALCAVRDVHIGRDALFAL